MTETGCVLGGEQSGHIIFRNISPTGDGILSALEFLNAILGNSYDLGEIINLIPKFPQVLKNIKVRDKNKILGSGSVKETIKQVETRLIDRGRLLVRPSGTEPLIRVMAEAESQELAEDSVRTVVESILQVDKFDS